MIDEIGVASSLAKLTGSIKTLVDRRVDSLDQGWTCVPLIFRVRCAQEAFSWTFRFEDLRRIIGIRLPIGAASYPSTSRTMHCNHCCRGKAIKYTFSVCVCVCVCVCARNLLSGMQSACAVLLSSLVCMAVPLFFVSSLKRHNLQKKFIEHKMRVYIFSTSFVWNVSHSKKNSASYYHKCA